MCLAGHTELCCAPEHSDYLDPTGLQRTDIYSYGILVWRVMLNGVEPYRHPVLQGKEVHEVAAITSAASHHNTNHHLSSQDFGLMKKNGDMLLHLAQQTIDGSPESDIPLALVRDILSCTVRADPKLRAINLGHIIDLFAERNKVGDMALYVASPYISYSQSNMWKQHPSPATEIWRFQHIFAIGKHYHRVQIHIIGPCDLEKLTWCF